MNLPSTSALLSSSGIEEIKLEDIRADEQVRTSQSEGFSTDSLRALADSIERIGVQEPIIVRPEPEQDKYKEKYRIVCGERRFRAAKMTTRQTIPAIIRSDLNDPKEIMFLQITENALRSDIDSMELAHGAQKLLELGMSKGQIATAIGKPNDYVSYLFSMLKMPEFLRREYESGHLSHSPRACYEYINLYNRDPDRCEQCIIQLMAAKADDEDLTGFLDRSLVKKIKAYIDEAEESEEEAGAEGGDCSPDGGAQDGGDAGEDGSDSLSGEDGDQEGGEDEYPDREGREHPAEVGMAPAFQDDDSHTAGLGKPDFTDRDTRQAGDLSDGIERGDESGSIDGDIGPASVVDPDDDDGADEEPWKGEGVGKNYMKLYVDCRCREYRLTYEIGPEPGTIMLVDENTGGKVAARMDEITLVRGV